MGEFVGGRIVPKHCGAWNKNSKYEMLSIVVNSFRVAFFAPPPAM